VFAAPQQPVDHNAVNGEPVAADDAALLTLTLDSLTTEA
jgi:hypothetical protein